MLYRHGIPASRLVAGIYIVFPFAAVVLPTTISEAKPYVFPHL